MKEKKKKKKTEDIPKSEKIPKVSKITFFKSNLFFSFLPKKQQLNAIILVLLFKEMSLWPELSSPCATEGARTDDQTEIFVCYIGFLNLTYRTIVRPKVKHQGDVNLMEFPTCMLEKRSIVHSKPFIFLEFLLEKENSCSKSPVSNLDIMIIYK